MSSAQHSSLDSPPGLFTIVDLHPLVALLACLLWFAHATSAPADDETANKRTEPDPVQLLRNVEQARLGLASGKLEIAVASTPPGSPKHGADRSVLKIVFDGDNRRFETTLRELSIDGSGPDGGEARRNKLEEMGDDREAFVRLGLGQWQENYYCTAYDGSRLLQSATGGGGTGTVIDDPRRGSMRQAFDPRTLGLETFPNLTGTVASFLAYQNARAIALVQPDQASDAKTWHVRVTTRWNEERNFWIDRECPTHVIRFERNALGGKQREVAVSHYADCRPENPLPRLVEVEQLWNGKPARRVTLEIRDAHYNIPTDPSSWTLAGLNMPIGTPVVNVRIHRRIGYWDGSGLSEELPTNTQPSQPLAAPPHAGNLLALAEKDPKSPLALDAAVWIIVNTPDGPDVKRAADILIREHIQDKNLGVLCQRLEDQPSETALRVLRAVLERNPHRLPRASASFALGLYLKQKLDAFDMTDVERSSLRREATELFERVASEDADVVSQFRGKLGPRAKRQLDELRRLQVGMVASDIKGRDADGKPFQLSDYRGKVVLLTFSASWCGPCVLMYPQKRELVKHYSGKPFAVLDVNADEELETLRKSVTKGTITWRCYWDGRSGHIARSWNVTSWPAVYLIDRQGVIRAKHIRGQELNQAIEHLMTSDK
jgi:thiol-disulfide isomerase/thioredoxin